MSLKNNAYFIVNLIFFILIGVIIGYSYFFYPNNQPITCIYKSYTGHNCSTCGFSRAFSSFIHLNYQEGISYNVYAFKCFLFFIFQWALRGYILLLCFKSPKKVTRQFITVELSVTILIFLMAFVPLLMA